MVILLDYEPYLHVLQVPIHLVSSLPVAMEQHHDTGHAHPTLYL